MSTDRHERAALAGGRNRAGRSALHLRNRALPGLQRASFPQSVEPQVAWRKRGLTRPAAIRAFPIVSASLAILSDARRGIPNATDMLPIRKNRDGRHGVWERECSFKSGKPKCFHAHLRKMRRRDEVIGRASRGFASRVHQGFSMLWLRSRDL